MSVSVSPVIPNDGGNEKSAHEKSDQRDRLGKKLLSIGDAVIVTDSLGNVILLNAAAELLTGWTDHDARDRPIETVFRIIHEVTREPVIQPVKAVIEHGGVQTLAQWTLLIAKNGSERAIADSASPIHDEAGHLDGVVLIFKDTTDRRAEERRHDEDRRHGEVIIATVRDPLVVLNSDLKIRSANPSFYEVFQTSPQETLNQSFLNLGNGQWKSEGLQSLLEQILNGKTSSGEYQVERDFPSIGKKVMLINARKLNGKDGQNVMILVAIEDITERSQIANSLAASEVRFRRLFESAKDGILILNAETGAIDDANPFLLDMLGYSRLEILGKHLWEIGLFGDIEASRISFRELQEKGYVRYENLPLETKDGQHVDVEVVRNVYHVNERMIIQCNIRDVTARKRVEDEIKRAKEASEASGRSKDRFLATLSHELRTPLTPVLATLAYLEMTPHLTVAEMRQQLDSLRRNVELEAQLIDDLLDVTRI
jgi:PAS domain S-box-containing protein